MGCYLVFETKSLMREAYSAISLNVGNCGISGTSGCFPAVVSQSYFIMAWSRFVLKSNSSISDALLKISNRSSKGVLLDIIVFLVLWFVCSELSSFKSYSGSVLSNGVGVVLVELLLYPFEQIECSVSNLHRTFDYFQREPNAARIYDSVDYMDTKRYHSASPYHRWSKNEFIVIPGHISLLYCSVPERGKGGVAPPVSLMLKQVP